MNKSWESLLASSTICTTILFVSAAVFALETPAKSEVIQPQVMLTLKTNLGLGSHSQDKLIAQLTSCTKKN